jgi:hypothetical protein
MRSPFVPHRLAGLAALAELMKAEDSAAIYEVGPGGKYHVLHMDQVNELGGQWKTVSAAKLAKYPVVGSIEETRQGAWKSWGYPLLAVAGVVGVGLGIKFALKKKGRR